MSLIPRAINRLLVLMLTAGIFGCDARSHDDQQAVLPVVDQSDVPEFVVDGRVVLGSPRLTSGIPGTGPLSTAEIQAWLNQPENHRTLEFALPAHLADAADQVFVPPGNQLTRARIELGRQLFFDRRLGTMSCADCHQPRQSYSAHQVFPDTGLNPLPAFNRILSRHQFWNGKAETLEDLPEFPVKNPFEMNTTPEQLVQAVSEIEGYRLQLERTYDEVSFSAISRALASFVRVLVTGESAYDRHLRGEESLSGSAKRGAALFFSERCGCAHCHAGPNFTDESFHNLGVGWKRPEPGLGRFLVTQQNEDRGAFKTPSLRNVALTGPFMHDGSFDTLEDVVQFFNAGGNPNLALSSQIRPLDLTDQEQNDLVAFLKSLTSPLPPVEEGRLPE